MIKVGDRLPSAKFKVMGPEGPADKTTDDIFKGKSFCSPFRAHSRRPATAITCLAS